MPPLLNDPPETIPIERTEAAMLPVLSIFRVGEPSEGRLDRRSNGGYNR